GDIPRSQEYYKKALGLIDKVSEYERWRIMQTYYAATGESDKSIDASQLGIRNYPRFWGFPNHLSVIYIDLGRYEEGLKQGRQARGVPQLRVAGGQSECPWPAS